MLHVQPMLPLGFGAVEGGGAMLMPQGLEHIGSTCGQGSACSSENIKNKSTIGTFHGESIYLFE